MFKNIKLILFSIPLFFLSVTASQAVVELVDTEESGIRNNVDNDITQGIIASGSGAAGDFEVIMCSTFSDGNNFFLNPTPGDWSELDSGQCGGSGACILGIFGRFDESADSSNIACNWTDTTSVFAAGSFRYSGVDIDNPIIAVACNSGTAGAMVAPSVITEPGSAVIGVTSVGADLNLVTQDVVGSIFGQGFSSSADEFTLIFASSFEFLKGGPTGDIILGSTSADWRACTIALRMEPTEIPTLSEWGMIASATGLMLIGVYFALKRKKIQVI